MTSDRETNKAPVVLVVDNDETLRRLAQSPQESAGLTVVEAVDGDEALARMNERAPDLILLDITLPRRNGFEICSEFRKQ